MNLAIFFIVALLVKAYTGRYRYFTASSSDTSHSDLKTYNLESAEEELERPILNPQLIRHEIVERLYTLDISGSSTKDMISSVLNEIASEYGLIQKNCFRVPEVALTAPVDEGIERPWVDDTESPRHVYVRHGWVRYDSQPVPEIFFTWAGEAPKTLYMYNYNSMLNLGSDARRYGLIEISLSSIHPSSTSTHNQ